MNVKELKEILSHYPDDMEIYTRDHIGHVEYDFRASGDEWPADYIDREGNKALMFY